MHKGENVGPRSLYNEVPKLEVGGGSGSARED